MGTLCLWVAHGEKLFYFLRLQAEEETSTFFITLILSLDSKSYNAMLRSLGAQAKLATSTIKLICLENDNDESFGDECGRGR